MLPVRLNPVRRIDFFLSIKGVVWLLEYHECMEQNKYDILQNNELLKGCSSVLFEAKNGYYFFIARSWFFFFK